MSNHIETRKLISKVNQLPGLFIITQKNMISLYFNKDYWPASSLTIQLIFSVFNACKRTIDNVQIIQCQQSLRN